MDKDIIEELGSIPNLELFVLYYDIKHVIEDKEISEETIFDAIKELSKYSSLGEKISYDHMTFYLENKYIRYMKEKNILR